MHRALFRAAALTAAVVMLASCGGGGGDSAPTPAPTPTPTPPPSGSVAISGVARYESVPSTASGALNYAGTTARPIRGAVVEILNADSSTVLATTLTDASGAYSASFAAGPGAVVVRVKAQLQRTGGPAWDVSVRDNTQGDALYALDSSAVTVSGSTLTRDLTAASGWSGSSYGATRAAAPFSILDSMYSAISTTLTAAPTRSWPALRVFWSVNNRAASPVNAATGAIGTSSYWGDGGTGTHRIYVLGDANNDTDEYDTHVIVHEWGHYFQATASRDDSLGGPHGGTDRLDPRVAFSEGWGNAWSGIALNNPIYTDSLGAGQASGFSFDVSRAPTDAQRGWYREDVSQYLIYRLNTLYGFAPLFAALNGFVADAVVPTTLFSLKAGIKQQVPASAGAIDALFASMQISGTDEYGTGESNNGGISDALPLYKTSPGVGVPQTLCVTNAADSGNDRNKLGVFSFARISLPATRSYTITLTGATGSDPDFQIFGPNRFYSEAISVVAGSETKTVSLAAGEHVIAVTDYNMTGRTCLTLTVN
jgi:hypothetical protein